MTFTLWLTPQSGHNVIEGELLLILIGMMFVHIRAISQD